MSETTASAPVRRRPRDRRQAIEAAAAAAFAEHGYHRVSMQDVADVVGISAAALYRHFENKYDLFREVALGLAASLASAVEGIDEGPCATADEASARLDELLDAIAGATIALRGSGGIYRWESRYLEPEDRHALASEFSALRRRIAVPLATLRPELDDQARRRAAIAALSAIASVTTHRTAMPASAQRALLHEAAMRVLSSPIPPAELEAVEDQEPTVKPRRRREQLAQAGIMLFSERGYHEVTIEDIAHAVGLTPSGVYRHFSGKSEILRTACVRAAETLDEAADVALAHEDASEALRILSAAYIDFAVDDRDLMGVYVADVGALDLEDQKGLRRLQRAHVEDWVELLGRVRPELDQKQRRFLVQAGFNVVADLSVDLRHGPASEAKALIAPLLEAVLGV
ncbi:TetR/AcrR family transcriptional regulator [Demequina zhanjiangensis]|uniref:TetR/AcrR family transcriptional regulator n=1 Tax=Demequina zhanjiangensis TaxID=3051659 RepID=A0ABT8G0G1_9MICO|nr:TetR/AcrR family transcriptional regulator [Demequina sp. SYSU T00b26]MDN4472631.1 TetR/AcrR family transcriptional regulator [Demequina sp. SYSU T00b26]